MNAKWMWGRTDLAKSKAAAPPRAHHWHQAVNGHIGTFWHLADMNRPPLVRLPVVVIVQVRSDLDLGCHQLADCASTSCKMALRYIGFYFRADSRLPRWDWPTQARALLSGIRPSRWQSRSVFSNLHVFPPLLPLTVPQYHESLALPTRSNRSVRP